MSKVSEPNMPVSGWDVTDLYLLLNRVGELWNGNSIVRTLGRPEIGEIIYIENDPEYKATCGLYTLKMAEDKNYLKSECKYIMHPR